MGLRSDDPSTDELGGEGSLLVRQRKDHALLDDLLGEVRGTRGAAQAEALTRLGRVVFPQAYGEGPSCGRSFAEHCLTARR